MTPDYDDLIKIDDPYDVEKILQTSLKQQFLSHGILPTSISMSSLPHIQDGGIDITIEISEFHSIPEMLGIGTNNNAILQVKHTRRFLTKTEVESEINKNAVKEFFRKHNGGTYVICYSKKDFSKK